LQNGFQRHANKARNWDLDRVYGHGFVVAMRVGWVACRWPAPWWLVLFFGLLVRCSSRLGRRHPPTPGAHRYERTHYRDAQCALDQPPQLPRILAKCSRRSRALMTNHSSILTTRALYREAGKHSARTRAPCSASSPRRWSHESFSWGRRGTHRARPRF
jgi:hypothetical protein